MFNLLLISHLQIFLVLLHVLLVHPAQYLQLLLQPGGVLSLDPLVHGGNVNLGLAQALLSLYLQLSVEDLDLEPELSLQALQSAGQVAGSVPLGRELAGHVPQLVVKIHFFFSKLLK